MENKTYKIPEANMGWLETKIEKLNRRASKLGQSLIELKTIGEEMVEYKQSVDPSIIPNFVGITTYKKFFKVEITGQAPVIAGWSFVGSIEHEEGGNIIKLLPNQIIPETYRTALAHCNHCNIDRLRNATFILFNGTDYKQIGRNCLRDFVGQDVADVISRATLLSSLDELGNAAEDEDFLGHNSSGKQYWNLKEYLANVVAVIEKLGFVSRKKAQELNDPGNATSDVAFNLMAVKDAAKEIGIYITKEHEKKAEEILAWLETYLNGKSQLNEYEHNLQVILEREFVSYSTLGFAASIASLHYRETAAKAEKEAKKEAKKPSEYVGEVGKRMKSLTLTLAKITNLGEGTFGLRYLYRFVDANDNVLVWFTGNMLDADTREFFENTVYTGDVSIKEHQEYKGTKQTVLTRCKLFSPALRAEYDTKEEVK
jgi:hypothetical protein